MQILECVSDLYNCLEFFYRNRNTEKIFSIFLENSPKKITNVTTKTFLLFLNWNTLITTQLT